jgi:hypothetical protein
LIQRPQNYLGTPDRCHSREPSNARDPEEHQLQGTRAGQIFRGEAHSQWADLYESTAQATEVRRDGDLAQPEQRSERAGAAPHCEERQSSSALRREKHYYTGDLRPGPHKVIGQRRAGPPVHKKSNSHGIL